jgi:predicted transporter
MIELLWKLGIIAAILIFGVKIGLAMGFAGISKKMGVLISVGYGMGILLLTILTAGYSSTLYTLVSQYSSIMIILMALILIYAGFHTLKEWKIHRKNHAKATCMAMVAPCPCCIGTVLISIILVSPIIGASSYLIGEYSAVFLVLTIIISYFISDTVVKLAHKPYPVFLGNFLFFAGFYFLISAIVLPNISSTINSPTGTLNTLPLTTIITVIAITILLIFIGFIIKRRNSHFLGKGGI